MYKFRVRNLKTNEIEKGDFLITQDGYPIIDIGFGELEFVWKDKYKVEFFTGIKDGQDKEIYLGDRVKIGNTVYTVVWYRNGFKLLNDGEYSEFPYNLYMEVVK